MLYQIRLRIIWTLETRYYFQIGCGEHIKNIVIENGGKIETYQLFDENGNFNFEDFRSKVLELAKTQKNVVLILNEPSHNPTGFRMTYEEWVNLMAFFKSIKRYKLNSYKRCGIF